MIMKDYSKYITQNIKNLEWLEKWKKYMHKAWHWREIVWFDETWVFWQDWFWWSWVCHITHFKKICPSLLEDN